MSIPADDDLDTRSYFIDGQRVMAPPLGKGLYPVATPIGNLADITLRALATLAAADMIACEDTRTSRPLLQRYGINRRLIAYHEHNSAAMLPRLLALIGAGKAVALISDAGTPLISDPGYRLVSAVIEAGEPVVPVPGPSAVVTALTAAGLPTDAFFFAGFLPQKRGERRQRLTELARVPGTLVFYETPHRIHEALDDLAEIYGAGRHAVLARELTKLYEDYRRLPLGALARSVADDPPRGEIVLMVAPPEPEPSGADEIDAMIRAALGSQPPGRIAADIAALTGRGKKDIYQRILELDGKSG